MQELHPPLPLPPLQEFVPFDPLSVTCSLAPSFPLASWLTPVSSQFLLSPDLHNPRRHLSSPFSSSQTVPWNLFGPPSISQNNAQEGSLNLTAEEHIFSSEELWLLRYNIKVQKYRPETVILRMILILDDPGGSGGFGSRESEQSWLIICGILTMVMVSCMGTNAITLEGRESWRCLPVPDFCWWRVRTCKSGREQLEQQNYFRIY